MVFGSDMPHSDREPFVVRKVQTKGHQRDGEVKDSRKAIGSTLWAQCLGPAVKNEGRDHVKTTNLFLLCLLGCSLLVE